MRQYKYEELYIGDTASFEISITEKMQDLFREISGDINPLHSDKNFAVKKGFEDKVVFGMLTASFYSRLAGVYLPGINCLIHSIEVKFLKPIYIGENIEVSGKITDKNDTFRRLVIDAQIICNSAKVSKAKIKVGVLNE